MARGRFYSPKACFNPNRLRPTFFTVFIMKNKKKGWPQALFYANVLCQCLRQKIGQQGFAFGA
jgi:hypothetical protein